jgi:hypothetical protein
MRRGFGEVTRLTERVRNLSVIFTLLKEIPWIGVKF